MADGAVADHEEALLYTVELTDEAFYAYATLTSERLFDHMGNSLGLLASCPELGQVYNPAYPTAMPDLPCRVLFCEHFGIYYRIDQEALLVRVLAIEDQRRDPATRFSRFEYGVVRLEEDGGPLGD